MHKQVIPAPKELKTQIHLKEILNQLPGQSMNTVENRNHQNQFKDRPRARNPQKDQQSDSTSVSLTTSELKRNLIKINYKYQILKPLNPIILNFFFFFFSELASDTSVVKPTIWHASIQRGLSSILGIPVIQDYPVYLFIYQRFKVIYPAKNVYFISRKKKNYLSILILERSKNYIQLYITYIWKEISYIQHKVSFISITNQVYTSEFISSIK